MEKQLLVQRIANNAGSPIEAAMKYYRILATINNIHITNTQTQLLAFMAVTGSISSGGAKETFSELSGCPKASIGNMVWKLRKKGLLSKDGKRVVLIPQLQLDFNNILVLQITIKNG